MHYLYYRYYRLIAVVLLALTIMACAQMAPLISHAHLGHALTAWHDTPQQQGLFIVAEKETDIAVKEAELAWLAQDKPEQWRQHINNVINALTPDLEPLGSGLGYGALRALEGSIEHMAYAAQSQDASVNIVSSVVQLSEQGTVILERLHKGLELAQQLKNTSANSLGDSSFQLWQTLNHAKEGYDLDDNGQLQGYEEFGLVQLRVQLQAMLNGEKAPAYQPLPRRYVLGLIRLPDGRWKYRLRSPSKKRIYARSYSYY